MKYTIFTIVFVLQSLLIFAQEDIVNKYDSTLNNSFSIDSLGADIDKYIYTYSGNIFTGEKFQIITENGSSYMKIDSFEIDLNFVEFIKFNNNFWANTNKLEGDNKHNFALRTQQSKINLYSRIELKEKVNYHSIYLGSSHIWADHDVDQEEHVFNYYNKELGELKAVNFNNLVIDLSDNQSSMSLLENSLEYKQRSVLFYVAGIASIVYGFSSGANIVNKENESNFSSASFYIPIGIGLGSIWLGSKMSKRNSEMILKAIENY